MFVEANRSDKVVDKIFKVVDKFVQVNREDSNRWA